MVWFGAVALRTLVAAVVLCTNFTKLHQFFSFGETFCILSNFLLFANSELSEQLFAFKFALLPCFTIFSIQVMNFL